MRKVIAEVEQEISFPVYRKAFDTMYQIKSETLCNEIKSSGRELKYFQYQSADVIRDILQGDNYKIATEEDWMKAARAFSDMANAIADEMDKEISDLVLIETRAAR